MVGGAVGVVIRRGTVEPVRRALGRPLAGAHQAPHVRGEGRGAVGHGHVDGLSLARARALEQRGEHADGEEGATAAEVGDEIQRGSGRLVGAAHGPQPARDGQVVQVVATALGERAGLTPSRHAGVDQTRVELEARFRSEPEAFHHTGAESLDEHISARDELRGQGLALLVAKIERDRPAIARHADL